MDYSSSFKGRFFFVETPREKISENILRIADFLGKGKKVEDILDEMQVLSPQKL